MNYIVFDLEATCWEKRGTQPNETIEIGAVKVSDRGEVIGEFEAFVKPLLHPQLSDFCQQLTTIRQEDVDGAAHFPAVIRDFREWLGEAYVLCSWGYYDKKQFRADCELSGIDAKWTVPHISIKHQYAAIKQLRRPVGMGRALKMEQLPLTGTHHRGIDDARNIAKIFLKYLDRFDFG